MRRFTSGLGMLGMLGMIGLAFSTFGSASAPAPAAPPAMRAGGPVEYRVLSTTKTSTLEKEMNAAAEAGLRFGGVMGGDTAFGGSEVVAIMSKVGGVAGRYAYKLLATSKTSTMQKELQEASTQGFEYKGQTVFESLFGGEEVIVILERDKSQPVKNYEYKLLATSKTSTLQKELDQAGAAGYDFVGMTVGKTAMGGEEVIVITRHAR